MRSANSARIPVGISQCLIGDPVRFNAGHKHSRLCTEHLGALFELRPFCPEVAIGLNATFPGRNGLPLNTASVQQQ